MLTDITLEEAQDVFREILSPLAPERVSLAQSLLRYTAFDLAAGGDLPAYSLAALDGYAVHAGDLGGNCSLLIGKTIGSGKVPASSLKPGNTMLLVTGGRLPEGAAAVIPQEDAVIRSNYLFADQAIKQGANIRFQGEDYKKGEIILQRNTRLTPGALGVLAAFGEEGVVVSRRPSVAIFCLGPDIVPYYQTPSGGEIRDSNGLMLSSLVFIDGGEVGRLEYISGTGGRESIINTIQVLFERFDMLIAIGGTAFGESEYQALPLFREAGAEVFYWGIRIKPGSHSGGGIWQGKPFIALSGNPSACVAGYHLLVTPILRRMQGLSYDLEKVAAISPDKYDKKRNVRRILLGRLFGEEGIRKVSIIPEQKSSRLKPLVDYNCLVDVPTGDGQLEVNWQAQAIPLEIQR